MLDANRVISGHSQFVIAKLGRKLTETFLETGLIDSEVADSLRRDLSHVVQVSAVIDTLLTVGPGGKYDLRILPALNLNGTALSNSKGSIALQAAREVWNGTRRIKAWFMYALEESFVDVIWSGLLPMYMSGDVPGAEGGFDISGKFRQIRRILVLPFVVSLSDDLKGSIRQLRLKNMAFAGCKTREVQQAMALLESQPYSVHGAEVFDESRFYTLEEVMSSRFVKHLLLGYEEK